LTDLNLPKRILFISTETRPFFGGVAHAVDGWLTGLAEAGHDVTVLSLVPPGRLVDRSLLVERNYREAWVSLPTRSEHFLDRIVLFRKVRSLFFLRGVRALVIETVKELVKKHEPGWVFFCVLNDVCCIPLRYLKRTGVRCGAIAHGSEVQRLRVPNQVWFRRAIGLCEPIIAVSDFTRRSLIPWGVLEEKIFVLHPALTLEIVQGSSLAREQHARQGASEAETVLTILTIGRLVERKGIQTILEAISRLSTECYNFRYIVIGDGPFRKELEDLSRRLSVDEMVTFLGNVTETAKADQLFACDIFAMTPFQDSAGDVEGFGIVFMEAALFGKPVIGTRSGGVADAVIDGQTGILVSPGNVDELVIAIRRLADNQGLRRRLGDSGRQWAVEHSPASLAPKFIDILEAKTLYHQPV
jgi:phosphatidyl-myo-inositol dimannoside synthase